MNIGSLGGFGLERIANTMSMQEPWWKIMSCMNIRYYASPGSYTYTVPESATELVVIVIGGGANASATNGGAASGCFAGFVKVEPGQRIPVTVGASNGGTSSFGNLVTVTGGSGRTTPGSAVYDKELCIPLISTTGGIGGASSSTAGGGGGGIGGGNGGNTSGAAGGGGGGFAGNGADNGGAGGGYLGHASGTSGGLAIPGVHLPSTPSYSVFKAWLTNDIYASFTGGGIGASGGFLGGGGGGNTNGGAGGFGGGGGGGGSATGGTGWNGGGGGGGSPAGAGGSGIVIVMCNQVGG